MPASRGEPRTGHPETLKGILHFSLRLHLKAARSLKLIEGFLGSRYALPRDSAMTNLELFGDRNSERWHKIPTQRDHLTSQESVELPDEGVELVVVKPVGGVLEGDDACGLEVSGAAVLFRV